MAKIKTKVKINNEESESIRRVWDENRARWYYSVTDVMAVLTDSVDARNYWKALKNRLKTSHNELVMDINQLKMQATDGKYYMNDVADSDTLIKILQVVAPHNIPPFSSYFDHIEASAVKTSSTKNTEQNADNIVRTNFSDATLNELSTKIEMSVDIYENKNEIIVMVPLPAFDPNKLFISANTNTLTIKGSRLSLQNNFKKINNIEDVECLIQELEWSNFERTIELPNFVDIENISAQNQNGMITIKLQKIDLEKTRYIKIKNS